MRPLIVGWVTLLILVSNVSSNVSWANLSRRVGIRGAISDFSETSVTVQNSFGSAIIPKSLWPKNLDIRPGNQVEIYLWRKDVVFRAPATTRTLLKPIVSSAKRAKDQSGEFQPAY